MECIKSIQRRQSARHHTPTNYRPTTCPTTSDIQNHADYSASSSGIKIGTGVGFNGKLTPGGTSAGAGKDSGSTESTTQAGISSI